MIGKSNAILFDSYVFEYMDICMYVYDDEHGNRKTLKVFFILINTFFYTSQTRSCVGVY